MRTAGSVTTGLQMSAGGECVLEGVTVVVGDGEGELDGVAEGSCTKVTCAVSPLQLLKSKLSQ